MKASFYPTIPLLYLSLSLCVSGQEQIIPKPAELTIGEGSPFILSHKTIFVYKGEDKDFSNRISQILSMIHQGTGLKLTVMATPPTSGTEYIEILQNPQLADKGEEAYSIELTPQGFLRIEAAGPKGVFYAAQSMAQMLPVEFFDPKATKNSITWKLAEKPFRLVDYPRFSWRALMIDEARHFFGEETIKQIIDQMAQLKMNVLHWHLTDDAGWRIEIKKYPKLTSIGSKRKDSETGTWHSGKREGKPHEGFYTQKQIRDIVQYAAQRNVTIVPEIEMPGHASAAAVAYPYLSLKPLKEVPVTFVTNTAYDPTSETTYAFLSDVLDEVISLFPSPILHIGGDEVRFNQQWKGVPEIEAFMKKKGLKSMVDVQMHFTNRMSNIIAQKGKRMMGWNEILGHDINNDGGGTATGKLDSNSVIQFWKGGVNLAKNAIRQGHQVVNSTHSSTYIDYSYGTISLGKAYDFEPIFHGLEPEYHDKVLGLGCQMWTEWVSNKDRLHYQIFPRACAFSEVGWTQKEAKNFKNFKKRLSNYSKIMDIQGINYAKEVASELSKSDFFNTPKLASWTPDSLKTGEEMELNLTPYLKGAGNYIVSFLYDRGQHAVDLSRVILFEDEKEISRDEHKGFSGSKKTAIQYKLNIPSIKQNSRYTLKVNIKGSGGTNSYGDIFVEVP